MAIAFRSKGAWVAGTTSISMTMPTTHVAGDLLLMFIHTANNAITTPPGNGWQLLSPSPVSTGSANTALGVRLTVYWKIATSSSEAAQTVSVTSGTVTNGLTVAYSGVYNTTPFDLTPVSAVQATSLANLSFPTLTTVTDGAMIVNVVALDNDTNSSTLVTSPVNASLVSANLRHGQTVSTSTGGGICFIDGIKTTAGLINATTATVAAAARAYLTIALRPAPESKIGSFAISQASTIASTGTKKTNAAISIAQASTVASTGEKTTNGTFSINQASTVVANGNKPVETHNGVFSIAQASTISATGKKSSKASLSLSQASTVAYAGSKKAVGSLAINQASTVAYTGRKSSKIIAQISQASSVASSGIKKSLASFQIAQAQTIATLGKKATKALLSISQASTIVFNGVKPGSIESKIGTFVINQAHTIATLGIKKNVGISTIFGGSIFASNGRKSTNGTFGMAQSSNLNTSGAKKATGTGNIQQAATLTANPVKKAVALIQISAEATLSAIGNRYEYTAEKIAVANKKTIQMIRNAKTVLIGPDRKTVSLTKPDVETVRIIHNIKEVCPWK